MAVAAQHPAAWLVPPGLTPLAAGSSGNVQQQAWPGSGVLYSRTAGPEDQRGIHGLGPRLHSSKAWELGWKSPWPCPKGPLSQLHFLALPPPQQPGREREDQLSRDSEV